MKRRLAAIRRDLVCLGILAAVLAVFLVPRFLTAGTVYFSTPHEHSGVSIHAAFQVANAALWREGVPLWNPWSGCGTPHLANLQSSVFFPLHALFLVLPPIPAAETLLVLRLLLAGCFAYVFGRALQLTRGAALFVGLAYALNAWQLRFANNAYGNGVMLLPLTCAAYLELGRSGRTRALAAATVLTALHVLAGLPESAAFSIAFAALLYLFAAFVAGGRVEWGTAPRRWAVLLGALSGGALLAAFQVLPFLEYLGEAWSTHLSVVDFSARRTPPETIAGLVYPFTDPLQSILSTSLSAGAVVLCFAVRGLVRPLRGGLNFLLGGYALLAALKVFGLQPVHSLGALPGLDALDFPLYLPPSVHLALALVAGLGFDEWRGGQATRSSARAWILAAVLAAGAWLLAPRGATWSAYEYALLAITAAVLVVAVLGRRRSTGPPGVLVAAVLALLTAELWLHYSRIPNDTTFNERVYLEPLRTGGGDVGEFLGEWLGDERRFRVVGSRLPNAALIWGPVAGFDYMDAIRVERFWSYQNDATDFWRVDSARSESSSDEARRLNLASVGAVVLEGDRHRSIATNLMPGLAQRGFSSFEGSRAPEIRPLPGVSRRVAALSDPPYVARTRWSRLGSFEQVALRYGALRAIREPVRFELVLVTRSGETTLLDEILPAGTEGWRDARLELPEGLRRAALEFRVSAPAGAARDVGFADLRLLRSAGLDEHLEVRYESSQFTVFENSRALPRAYVVHRAIVVPAGRALDALASPNFEPGRDVILEVQPPIPLPGGDETSASARIVTSDARRVVIDVQTERDGLLVLNDTFYPGWTARVDGLEQEILPANGMFRAVPVESGRHTVEFTYDPWSFRLGVWLTLATALGLIAVAVRRRDPAPGEPMRRFLARALVGLASAVTTLGALELVARAVGSFDAVEDLAEWVPADDSFTPPPNRFGHREEPLEPDVSRGDVTRVLFLGDSFTYGHGLPDGSERFTDRVERALRERGERVHIYNAGVNGANPTQWAETLEIVAPAYEPDVVIGVFFLRCGTALPTSFYFYERDLRSLRRRYEKSPLYDRSALYRWWAERCIRREFTEHYIDGLRSAYLGDESETETWRQEQAALREIQSICTQRGVEFHLVLFPMLYELDDYAFGAVEEELARFAAEVELPVYSLTPAFLGRRARELWVHAADQHPNAEGHRIAAEALVPYVYELVQETRDQASSGTSKPRSAK